MSTMLLRKNCLPDVENGRGLHPDFASPFPSWQQKIIHTAIILATTETTATIEKRLWWISDWLAQDYDDFVVLLFSLRDA
jgi:hypothetical protein